MAPGDEGVDEEDEVISVGHGEDRVEEQAVPANVDGDSEEAVVPKAMRDPGQPTEREREDHEVAAHQPPRAWCAECNGGRMQHDHHRQIHRQDPPEEIAIPCVSMDYCFMGSRDTLAKDNPILVVFDNRTKSLGAWQVYQKGAVDWVGTEVSKWIDSLGYKHCRIAIKSDNENSITALKDLISETRSGPTVPITSPARESKSNGAMEARVKTWQSQFRTLLLDLQRCIGCTIPLGKSVISWLVCWSATSLNKYKLDDAGRTAFHRVTGSEQKRPVAKFGENVWWIPNGKRDPGFKAESIAREGVYLGIVNQTSESIIATDKGIVCVRTVRRMPVEQRWSRDKVFGIKISVAGIHNLGVETEGTGVAGGNNESGSGAIGVGIDASGSGAVGDGINHGNGVVQEDHGVRFEQSPDVVESQSPDVVESQIPDVVESQVEPREEIGTEEDREMIDDSMPLANPDGLDNELDRGPRAHVLLLSPRGTS